MKTDYANYKPWIVPNEPIWRLAVKNARFYNIQRCGPNFIWFSRMPVLWFHDLVWCTKRPNKMGEKLRLCSPEDPQKIL